MHARSGWLGVAAVLAFGLIGDSAHAQGQEPLKPYVLLILDTSGSMDGSTGTGPPSCPGGVDTRISHAKCAINNIANSYGDMVLALGRFRETSTDMTPGDGCTMNGIDCNACDENTGTGCSSGMSDDARMEVLVGLSDGNNQDLVTWTNNTAGTCQTTPIGSDPEIGTGSWTPIAGSLRAARRYWQGLQATSGATIWPSASPGFDPIRNDPFRNVFLPSGEQCRPYVTIMLTDGDETCTTFTNTTGAATNLLTTAVDAQTYRIETRPIGFGQSPGDTQIEGLAHAGGAADAPGVNEGLYAQSEEELQIAISTIIADAVRSERCNSLDDDCDTRVDEDFPSKGQVCDDGEFGVCRGTGTFVCRADGAGTQCNITNPGGTASTETCDGEDDDCDGRVDENACVGCGSVEQCNNLDDDCDTLIDEGLNRACGTDVGACTAGNEVCVTGAWQGCTATGPFTEVCNGTDDDCDNVIDGFVETCSNLPGGNPNTGICHPGTRACNTGGMFGACVGEIGPRAESCNNLDDDCDTRIDEGTGGGDCSTTCGSGTIVCTGGVLMCDSTTQPDDDTCDGNDDDCDGMVDEDAPPGGMCNDGGRVCNGMSVCMSGQYVCVGDPVQPTDLCDCNDNDCDMQVDENNGMCPSGATCTSCQCAFPCGEGEFPCPSGRTCVGGFCLVDRCFGVTCGPDGSGNATACDPDDGTCKPACSLLTCSGNTVCVPATGTCEPNDCRTFPDMCADGEQCAGGTCVANPCFGVTCAAPQYCSGGTCVASCGDVDCPSGQRCELGACVADPCGGACRPGFVCNDGTGECVADPCDNRTCPPGQACNPDNGECELDRCLGITCPNPGEVCEQGTCYDPVAFVPDAGGPPELVTTGGGGGCASSGGHGGGLLGLGLVMLGVLARGRRRRHLGGGL
ncbi:MAG: hypothetical protein KBG28_06715 [Kofleriaceae bacterium]|jgi:MYXO-CTERM domain-containing protein|nr:hypothetical protein [Kofleriaceae bacterium]